MGFIWKAGYAALDFLCDGRDFALGTGLGSIEFEPRRGPQVSGIDLLGGPAAARATMICPEGMEFAMLDTILIAAGLGFFVVAVLYVFACDRM